MMLFNFIEDKQRDMKNWQESITQEGYGIEWIKFIPNDISKDCIEDQECLSKYLGEKYYRAGKVADFISMLKENFNEELLRKDLVKIMEHDYDLPLISVIITTFHRAPYNFEQNFFYLIYRENNIKRAITNIYHETSHFVFHKHYWKQFEEAGLKEQEIHTIKEGITVLLNEALERPQLPKDDGYPSHQSLRRKILLIRKRSGSFKDSLAKIIVLVKEGRLAL